MSDTTRDFRFGSAEDGHAVHGALSALRLGSTDPAHAETLFSLFTLDSVLNRAINDPKIAEDCNACLLLLAKQMTSRRPMQHSYLDAVSNTFIETQYRLCQGLCTKEQYSRLREEAKATAPAYRETLLNAVEQNGKALETELKAWAKRTVGSVPAKAASLLARSRISAAEFELGSPSFDVLTVGRCLSWCYACGSANPYIDQRPLVECALGFSLCSSLITHPGNASENLSVQICEALCAAGLVLRNVSSSSWSRVAEYSRCHAKELSEDIFAIVTAYASAK